MWQHCGRHVLASELALLAPQRILVLGTGDNARAMREHGLRGPERDLRRGSVRVGRRELRATLSKTDAAWGTVDLLVAPHPAGPGGNARSLLACVGSLFTRT